MKISFDLDGVFVHYPPFIPSYLIDWLYRKRSNALSYRIPGLIEQQIRIFSHSSIFRQPIKENIHALFKIKNCNLHEIYLISGRFGFLQDKTQKWFRKQKINKLFKEVYLNLENKQPHLVKDQIIKRLKIHLHVDDDFPLIKFLAEKNPKTKFFWLNPEKSQELGKNLFAIKKLTEIFK